MWLHVYVGVIDVVGCVSVVTRWEQVFSWDWLLGQHVKSLSHVKALWLCDTTCVRVCVCVCVSRYLIYLRNLKGLSIFWMMNSYCLQFNVTQYIHIFDLYFFISGKIYSETEKAV